MLENFLGAWSGGLATSLSVGLIVYLFRRSLGLWWQRMSNREYRRFTGQGGNGMLIVYKRFDFSKCTKIGNWNIWNTGEDEDLADPFHSIRYSSGAFVSAEPIKSEGYCGDFRLNTQCYNESPNKLHFGFAVDQLVNPANLMKDDKNSVLIKFGDEKPICLSVTIKLRDPCIWRFDEEDEKFIRSSLLKSDRMLVRWYERNKYDGGTEFPLVEVTAKFNLAGTKEAFAEIKKRCKDYLRR